MVDATVRIDAEVAPLSFALSKLPHATPLDQIALNSVASSIFAGLNEMLFSPWLIEKPLNASNNAQLAIDRT